MRRHLSLCTLVLLLAWQGIATAGCMTVVAVERAEHGAVHSADTSHHHHADRTTHFDYSSESTEHSHADHGVGVVFLVTDAPATLPAQRPPVALVALELAPPYPFFDGPLRPPRHIA